MSANRSRFLVWFTAALVLLGVAASQASAAPGAYRIIIVQANCEPPTELQTQLAAFPDVAVVDMFNACEGTPTLGQLAPYDMVVSMDDDGYEDPVAFGNVLADYVDSGGVVFQYAYDSEDSLAPQGRFAEQGYPPFIPGNNPNDPLTLGEFEASNPLMQGVTALATIDNTEPALAPGATLVAKWSDGRNLLAYKGRVVSASAYIGDNTEWSGDFARLTVNAVRWLGRHTLTVANANPAGGTVTGSAGGISCGSVCSAPFVYQTPVSLVATANPGFAFAGFAGACTGTSCGLTMDADKSVSANFDSFGLAKKVKLNKKKGTGSLTVNVGGAGSVVLSGGTVKLRSKTTSAASKVLLPVLPKGKAAKKLKKGGKVKVKCEVTFTPSGGAAASLSKSILLRSRPRSRG